MGRANKELKDLFKGDGYKKESLDYSGAFIATIGAERNDAIERARAQRLVFVDNMIPIDAEASYAKGSFDDIISKLSKILDKGRKFRIEVKKIVANFEGSAKDIEVALGRKLEGLGIPADLEDPASIAYVILSEGSAFVGVVGKSSAYSLVVDRFRQVNKEAGLKVSRAEFKLSEALEFFGIDPKELKLCIDFGAAPGGWSAYMMRNGSQVIAIDNANLDYEMLSKIGKVEVTDGNVSVPEEWDLLHVKANVRDVQPYKLDWAGEVDALLLDMNIDSKESATIAERFSPLLKSDGILVLTIKLMDNNIEAHIENARSVLDKSFTGMMVKKLPHNRLELTLFARKR